MSLNPNEPLGLPRGSVRALLALLVVVGAFAYFFAYQVFPTEVVGILSIVVTFYFMKRERDDFDDPPEEPLPEPYIGGDE